MCLKSHLPNYFIFNMTSSTSEEIGEQKLKMKKKKKTAGRLRFYTFFFFLKFPFPMSLDYSRWLLTCLRLPQNRELSCSTFEDLDVVVLVSSHTEQAYPSWGRGQCIIHVKNPMRHDEEEKRNFPNIYLHKKVNSSCRSFLTYGEKYF